MFDYHSEIALFAIGNLCLDAVSENDGPCDGRCCEAAPNLSLIPTSPTTIIPGEETLRPAVQRRVGDKTHCHVNSKESENPDHGNVDSHLEHQHFAEWSTSERNFVVDFSPSAMAAST